MRNNTIYHDHVCILYLHSRGLGRDAAKQIIRVIRGQAARKKIVLREITVTCPACYASPDGQLLSVCSNTRLGQSRRGIHRSPLVRLFIHSPPIGLHSRQEALTPDRISKSPYHRDSVCDQQRHLQHVCVSCGASFHPKRPFLFSQYMPRLLASHS